MNKLLKKSTNYFIIFFSFVLVFFSTISTFREGNWYNDIGNFFHSGIGHPKFFTPFVLIVLLLMSNLLLNYKVKLKFTNGLFIFAILTYIFRMANPNAETVNPVFGLPLFSNINEYTFLFLLLVLVSLQGNLKTNVLEKIFRYVLIFSLIRSIILLILYFTNSITTVRWDSYSVILDEPDNQFLFSFLGAMAFSFYLVTKRKKYFYVSTMLLGIVFMSVQRSTFLPGFISIFFVLLVSIIKKIPTIFGKSITIIILGFMLFEFTMIQFPESKLAFATNRYMGAVVQSMNAKSKAFSDTGHFEQSALTIASVLQDSPLFGVGYGNFDNLYLYGQTTNIHNAYAAIWAHHGIFSLLFYLFFLYIIVKCSFRFIRTIDKTNYSYYLPKIAASFYLVGYFSIAWFTPEGILNEFRFQVFWMLIFTYITIGPITSNNKIRYERNY